jgi:hypothetical protein
MIGSFAASTAPLPRRDILEGVGHNACYRREVLLREFGTALEHDFDAEGGIHRRLRERGYRIVFDPQVQTRHVNISLWWSAIRSKFVGGFMFGAGRSQDWTWTRRLLYMGGTPLMPFLMFYRLLPTMRELLRRGEITVWSPLILFGFHVLSAIGESLGYLLGYREFAQRIFYEVELNRYANITAAHRARLESDPL